MTRNRIVIDLSRRVQKTRRWPRVLGILAAFVFLVVVLAAVAGFFWWRRYQSTPAYALTLLLDAAQRNDTAQFQKSIDDEEVAKNMVASVSERAAGRYGLALSTKTKQQIDSMVPSLLSQLKLTIRDEVAKEIKELASKPEPRPFIFLLITVPSLMTITSEGDSAKASAALKDRKIDLTMHRSADGWKVTAFNDDVVVQRVVDSVMKQLPAIGGFDSKIPILKPRKHARRR
jgi:hypothetical protein